MSDEHNPNDYEVLLDLPNEFEDGGGADEDSSPATVDRSVPRPPKLAEPAQTEVFAVDILTAKQDILNADADGMTLRFDPQPGYFRELVEDEIRDLSNDNRVRYHTTEDVNRSLVQEASGRRPVGTSGLDVIPTRVTGDSAARIQVHASAEQKEKYHYYWAGAHEWRDLQKTGYSVVRGSEVETNCLTPSDTHQILRNGQLEHILLKCPTEQFDAHTEAVAQKSQERIKGVTAEAKDRMSASGAVTPFEGDTPPGRGAQGVAWNAATETPAAP